MERRRGLMAPDSVKGSPYVWESDLWLCMVAQDAYTTPQVTERLQARYEPVDVRLR